MDKQKSIITSNVYKSRLILLEQLRTRGFNVEHLIHFDIYEIYTMIQHETLDFNIKHPETNEQVYVIYSLTKTPSQSNILSKIEELGDTFDKSKDQLLYIIKQEPNQKIIETCKLLFSQEHIFISVFNIHRLLYNILKHEKVPKHRVMTKEEKETLMKQYHINRDKQFPEISRFDPVAMVIGLRPGQLCEIQRKSETTIYSKYYRICI